MPYPSRTDRAAIVAAAIVVLDERGLDDVSLRAIAAHLGIRQPALYHHFASKAGLLDAVADDVLLRRHTDRLPVDGERWDAFVARNARSMRRAMLSIRDGARLIASSGSRSPQLDTAVAQVGLLENAGFTAPDAILALIAVARYTIGSAIEQQTARDGGNIVIDTDRTDSATNHLIDSTRHVVALGQDHEYETGLAALIRGLAPTDHAELTRQRKRPMTTTFRGVFLTSTSPQATANFYRDVAQFPLETVAEGGYTYWRFDRDSVQVAIHDAEAFAEYAYPPDPGSNLTHLYFKIDDRDDFLAHLHRQGIEPVAADDIVVTVADPDGRKVMFGTA